MFITEISGIISMKLLLSSSKTNLFTWLLQHSKITGLFISYFLVIICSVGLVYFSTFYLINGILILFDIFNENSLDMIKCIAYTASGIDFLILGYISIRVLFSLYKRGM